MSRTGKNPNRWKPIPGLPGVVAAVTTHLPNQSGYHEHRLSVVKASLLSLRKHANVFVHIFDNGSCEALRDWLLDEYKPDALTLMPNIGKAAAQAMLFRSYHPDTVIACADDDMLYYPGWLDAQLKLLLTYPEAVVTGYPTRSAFREGNKATLAWAKKNAKLESGMFMSDEWFVEYCKSVGSDMPIPSIANQNQSIVTYMGVKAYATGHHCQFMTRAKTFLPFVEWVAAGTRNERVVDVAIDEAGILRLATMERYTKHIGNILDGAWLEQAQEWGVA